VPKLTTDDLLSIIEAHERDAIGSEQGDLSNKRSEALKRYFGEPYGDEVEGRSSVVSKDLAEAIDWIMPNLLRPFLTSDDFVRFDPVGPEDEQQAEQESDYVNYVLMKENHGFCWLYDWFKDALLLKNGYVKRWWYEDENVKHETYANLTQDELVQTMLDLESSGDDIDVVGQKVEEQKDDMGNVVPVYQIKIRRKKKYGCVKIEGIPPEELRVSRRARGNLQESPFVQHVTKKMRSELIEMGLSKSFIDELPAWIDTRGAEEIQRDSVSDENNTEASTIDKSTDEIEYCESWLRVDFDDDGIAELRQIVRVGNKIPIGEDWNREVDEIPISYLTPNRLPHRHVGLSIQDELEDLAQIKTALWRGMLDNTYGLNNHEWLVNERVHLPDFMVSRPLGIKRVSGREPILDAAKPVDKIPILQHVLPVLDYMDTVKENRVGVGRNVMGLDPDTLKKTTEGAARQALQQANAKIEMIARLFAETGVKDLALAVHSLLIKHMDKNKVVRLRNKWVEVRPTEWRERTDMTVSVGLGTGSQEEVRANLMLMSTLQQQAAQGGVVSPRNIYNLAEKLSDNLGFKQKGTFFTDPDSPEGQQLSQSMQQPNPLAEAEQIKAQSKEQTEQLKAQLAQMKEGVNHQHEMHKLELDKWKFEHEHALNIAKAEIEAAKNAVTADLGQPGLGTETKGNGARNGEIQPMKISIQELQEVSQAANNGNQQLAEMLAQLLQQNQQIQQIMTAVVESLNRPRDIVLRHNAAGKPIGATSTIQ